TGSVGTGRRAMRPARSSDVLFYAECPPFWVHSSGLVVITKPLPLQPFWPLQSFCALLQELWPLHEFAPTHLVPAPCADPLDVMVPDSCAIAAEAKNSAATAEARIAPLVPLFIVFSCSAERNRFSRRPSGRSSQTRLR